MTVPAFNNLIYAAGTMGAAAKALSYYNDLKVFVVWYFSSFQLVLFLANVTSRFSETGTETKRTNF